MIAHNVYFRLHDRSDAARTHLVQECKRYLEKHPGVVFFACGLLTPELNRPVNDRDFDVALHVVFDSLASHDLYQTAPDHETFIQRNREGWAQVRVFDSTVD
jgi:hypothetical protein